MADEDIRRYSLEEIKAMIARGEGETDWDAIRAKTDAEIAAEVAADPDASELDEKFWRNARVVMPPRQAKRQVSVRLDADILDWFKAQGPRYHSRINAVLRAYVESRRRASGTRETS